MTSTTSLPEHAKPVDVGPLTWLAGEIRSALTQAGEQLAKYVETQDPSVLRIARLHVHQAHGALDIADVTGASAVVSALEELLDVVEQEPQKATDALVTTVRETASAVSSFLDELIAGDPNQPLRLYPYYKEIQLAAGVTTAEPADLFYPDLSIHLPAGNNASQGLNKHILTRERTRFERGLLALMRTPGPAAFDDLAGAARAIESLALPPAQRVLWFALAAMLEALRDGALPISVEIKQLLGRTNIQLRRLLEGSGAVAERLVKDVFFYLAAAKPNTEAIRSAQKTLRLNGMVPNEYLTKRYGKIDPAKVAAVKKLLEAAKSTWNSVVSGDLAQAKNFAKDTQQLKAGCAELSQTDLVRLTQELSTIAVTLGNQNKPVPDQLALDIATTILFIETALDNLLRLEEDVFRMQVDAVIGRLRTSLAGRTPTDNQPWLDEITRKAQERQTMAQLIGEIRANLGGVEKGLDDFFRDPTQRAELPQVQNQLNQLTGVLTVLGHPDAVLAISSASATVKQFTQPDYVPNPAQFENIASSLGALGFFVESLLSAGSKPTGVYKFDQTQQRFVALPPEPPSAANAVKITDVDHSFEFDDQDPAMQAMKAAGAVAAQASSNTVESELTEHREQAQRLMHTYAQDPNNLQVRSELTDTLRSIAQDAQLIQATDIRSGATHAIEALRDTETATDLTALSMTLSPVMMPEPEPEPVMSAQSASKPAPIAMPEIEEAVDEELLEIFLGEAQEVLETVGTALAVVKDSPNNNDAVTTLRRCFHTLKGSGRMVGLNVFGEAAWSVEQTLNHWLSEGRAVTPDLYELIETSSKYMGGWINMIQEEGKSTLSAQPVVDAANLVRADKPFVWSMGDAAAPELAVEAPVEAPIEEPVTLDVPAVQAPIEVSVAPEVASTTFSVADEAIEIEVPIAASVVPAPAVPEPVAPEPVLQPISIDVAQPSLEIPVAPAASADDGLGAFSFSLDTPPATTASVAPTLPEVSVEPQLPVVAAPSAEATSMFAPLAGLGVAAAAAGAAFMSGANKTPEIVSAVAAPSPEEKPGSVFSLPPLPTEPVEPAPERRPDLPEDFQRIGNLTISRPLFNIYMAEADECLRVIAKDFAEWRHEKGRPPSEPAVRATHSLSGSSATVGLHSVHDLSAAIEAALLAVNRRSYVLDESEHDLFEHGAQRLKAMVQEFSTGNLPESDETLLSAFEYLCAHVMGEIQAPVATVTEQPMVQSFIAAPVAPTPIEIPVVTEPESLSASLAFGMVQEPPAAPLPVAEDTVSLLEEAASQVAPEIQVSALDDIPVLEEPIQAQPISVVPEPVASPVTSWSAPPVEPPAPVPSPASSTPFSFDASTVASLAAGATALGVMGAAVVSTDAKKSEDIPTLKPDTIPESTVSTPPIQTLAVEASAVPPVQPVQEVNQPLSRPISIMSSASVQATVAAALTVEQAAANEALSEQVQNTNTNALIAKLSNLQDELDPDLFSIFSEEAQDYMPKISSNLRALRAGPGNSSARQALFRELHTVKGSARMAGALRLGQVFHEMETRAETAANMALMPHAITDQLLSYFDVAQFLYDQALHDPSSTALPAFAPTTDDEDAQLIADVATVQAVQAEQVATPQESIAPTISTGTTPIQLLPEQQRSAQSFLRVRADLIDRLVNQAGEVAIARSRVESETQQIRGSLLELTDNLSRLRSQLREIEIQAESQLSSRREMLSREAQGFDPLEFDRFTRLQELTRMMAESVNDVATVQQSMLRSLEGTNRDLLAQSRLTRDLQQDLMSVRMVRFDSVEERLYRVVRQSAKDVDKRVNLDVRGGSVELDRSVLERMTGPFEHLLRNCVAHGIESRQARTQTGKAEAGAITVHARQVGNEVLIEVQDDGAGLNYAKIRERGIERGLISADKQYEDRELAELIFQSGFSTATSVTELSGRGVGMDVVRAEATVLGGRVMVHSDTGKGSRFTIALPLTLATTQVVLAQAGEMTHALPSSLVELVMQLKPNALEAAYQKGYVEHAGEKVKLYFLPHMLGYTQLAPIAQRYTPIAIIRSGDERVAVHVDEIIGNQEVVVKNIGPQLARMLGIAGATVLGTGDIVMILNPAQLAQRTVVQRAAQAAMAQFAQPAGEQVSTQAPTEPALAVAQVQALPTIMVVDDSLTVRRVTERLLTRQGYQVVLAKDGVDALTQLQDVMPDVMLVDIEMPRMDGFDLTRNIRSTEAYKHIPIIMITSRMAEKHRNVAMELGVNQYLGKPYQDDELLEHIRQYVGDKAPAVVH